MSYAEKVTDQMEEWTDQVEGLSKDDLATVAKKIGTSIGQKLEHDPYEYLATAFGVGVGLAMLNSGHFKKAALRIGKLIAFKSLSQLEINDGGSNGK